MTKLQEIIHCIQNKHVYIQTHNFPDPDAIATAYGMQKLLNHYGIDSTICYKGKIDRNSIIKLIHSLQIEIVNIDSLIVPSGETEVILVDSQKGNANVMSMDSDSIICIDHHPTYQDVCLERTLYACCDIRPEVGACASIIAGYFYENNIPIDRNTATALMYGIKIDTANMSRGVSELDLEMFYRLYKICDITFIRSLESNNIQLTDLKAYANALDTILIYNNISFANTGINCPEALIATISDFVLAISEINLSIVYSIKEDGIKISIRSDESYDSGAITKKALKGIGNGGGHERMAGGFIPFEENSIYKDQEIGTFYITRLVEDMKQRFINVAKKEQKHT